MLLDTLAGIAWDPQIRGFLATAVGVVVLMGSVYLLVGTNLGSRLGFLISGARSSSWAESQMCRFQTSGIVSGPTRFITALASARRSMKLSRLAICAGVAPVST